MWFLKCLVGCIVCIVLFVGGGLVYVTCALILCGLSCLLCVGVLVLFFVCIYLFDCCYFVWLLLNLFSLFNRVCFL